MSSLFRRIAVCAVVITGILAFTAVPAAAGTARVEFLCGSVGPIITPHTFDFTITPPATARRGQTATVSAKVTRVGAGSSSPVPAGQYEVKFDIALEGAGAETLRVVLTNPAIPVGGLLNYSGSAQLTFPNTGTVNYRPARLVHTASSCIPRYPDSVPVVATTQVS